MKFFTFKNFIFGFIFSITIFCGLNLLGFCANRTYTMPSNQSMDMVIFSSAFPNNSTWKNYTYPVTQVTMSVGVTASPVANFLSYCEEAHIVTSEGDFLVASSASGSTANTVTVAGYPVTCYYVGKASTKVFTSGTASVVFTYYSYSDLTYTVSDNSGLSNYLTMLDSEIDSLQSDTTNIYSDTQQIIQMLDNFSNGKESWYKVSHNSAVETATYRWELYKYQLTRASGQANSGTITFSSIPDKVNVYLYCSLANGELALVNSFNESNINSSGVLTISYLFTNDKKIFEYMPLDFFICVEGVDRSSFTFTFPTNFTVISSFKAEFSDWSTIKNSQELADLNSTSGSIGTIISDNNNFESSAFTDFSSNLEEFGFDDWSLVPISSELNTTKNIITMFYNILPFKVQWLFTSVMALGLIVMLLTVGTRVVQRTGDFTRAKPVKMKDSSRRKG